MLGLKLNHVSKRGYRCCINTLRPRQNGRHVPDDIFKCFFLNDNVWIAINISLKFVPWGSKQQFLSICSDNGLAPARRQTIIWAYDDKLADAYMRHSASMSYSGDTDVAVDIKGYSNRPVCWLFRLDISHDMTVQTIRSSCTDLIWYFCSICCRYFDSTVWYTELTIISNPMLLPHCLSCTSKHYMCMINPIA